MDRLETYIETMKRIEVSARAKGNISFAGACKFAVKSAKVHASKLGPDSNQEVIAKQQADIDALKLESLRTLLEQAEHIKLLRDALERQRVGNANLIDFDVVPERYYKSVQEEINLINKALAATKPDEVE